MTAVELLTEMFALGGRAILDPDKPRLLVPPGMGDRIRAERETVREILRRAIVFRAEAERFVRDGGVLPLLTLPGAPAGPCISCGGDLAGGRYRCPVCAMAVNIALDRRGGAGEPCR
jgi:hypothetical protein